MKFLLRILTWWTRETIGTQLFTWRNGVLVGEDTQGNRFYRTKDDKRRWVIYNGEPEASRITPDWHGWLHHTYDASPIEAPLAHKAWEKPHHENLSGTTAAYVPKGSILREQPVKRADYEAWQPE